MLKNYLKTAFRSVLRERYYALIKIFGLALGLGTSMTLMLYVSHQLSYDNFHPDIDRLYRINQTNIWDPEASVFSSTGPAVASALKQDFPEIEEILRINTPGGYTVRYERPDGNVMAFNENFSNVFAADSNFFSIFGFKLKEGDARTALMGKNKVVLSSNAAKKLFGDEPALGKMIQLGDESGNVGDGYESVSHNKLLVEVTGVAEEQPSNVHFHFDYLLSMYTNRNIKRFEWSWIWTQVVTYVKLRPDANVEVFKEKLRTFADRHAPATFKRIGMDYEEFIKEKGHWFLYLQPVKDIHLYSGSQDSTNPIGNRLGPTGDIKYVYILGIVALFILLIAIVNFINLSTARGAKRAKEVGVKKTLGQMRTSLIVQFQVEHILITSVAMLLGLGVMELLRILLQPLGFEIPLSVWSRGTFAIVLIAFPVLIGFVAGLYPAFYLTSFRPAQVLKGKLLTGFRSSGLRNGLVVFQFTISIALMAATLIVFQQLDFFRSKDLGFEKENLLIIERADKLGKQLESFREEISHYPGVLNASLSMDIRNGYQDIFNREGDDRKITLSQYKIDEHFFDVTKLSLAAGRPFDENRLSDENSIIINETAARLLEWSPEEALGKRIDYMGDDLSGQEIIGVVKDFHFQSLRQNIEPLVFFNIRSKMWGAERIVLVKYNTNDARQLMNKIEQRWSQLVEATPIEIALYDEELKMQYKQEEQLGSLFSIFTGLSITIAIIGLVGLVAYSAEQRKKEIGIRKVFGASLTRIYVMINSHYIKLVTIAIVLATPITWALMQEWLETFTYRVDINPWIFAIAGIVELALALFCVGYLALRAASLNPAEVLKDE